MHIPVLYCGIISLQIDSGWIMHSIFFNWPANCRANEVCSAAKQWGFQWDEKQDQTGKTQF